MIDPSGTAGRGVQPRHRLSGILLHPTSLPGPHGVGDLGEEAYHFVRWLEAARQGLWQIMPLGPPGYGHSPYAARSAFAGNPLLISLDRVVERGWLQPDEIAGWEGATGAPVAFHGAEQFKTERLERAFTRFSQAGGQEQADFEAFRERERNWLDDFALFTALKQASGGAAWFQWDEDIVLRRPAALARARQELDHAVQVATFGQFLFFQQWSELKRFANERGIRIIGDIPIFVAEDSADVWAHRDVFYLDAHGRPTVVAGVPPDYFSPTGQRWGNPLYNWDALAERGYDWWVSRFRATLELVDIIRLDHFRGFESYYTVPAEHETAELGDWRPGPGSVLFRTIQERLGNVPIMVEDLGEITPEVEQLRDEFGFPGMKVLQFAFGEEASGPPTGRNLFLPHNYIQDCVVYTGTHDNDTTRGWWETRSEAERHAVLRYLGKDDHDIVWDLVRLALGSAADTAIFPIQDILDLGSDARMNLPGSGEGNWAWRYYPGQVDGNHAARLAELVAVYGRK